MNSKQYKGRVLRRERGFSQSHAILLVRLRCMFPAASVLRDLATFYEHFTTRFLPLFTELLDRRGVTLCSARACLWDAGSLFSGAVWMDTTRRRCSMSSHSSSSGGIRFGECLAKNYQTMGLCRCNPLKRAVGAVSKDTTRKFHGHGQVPDAPPLSQLVHVGGTPLPLTGPSLVLGALEASTLAQYAAW